LYSTHFTTVEIKIIALYAYWKAVFDLERAKCHIIFQLPDQILCWDHTHKDTYHLLPISKDHRKNHTEDIYGRRRNFFNWQYHDKYAQTDTTPIEQ